MTAIKLYFDEMMPRPVAEGLVEKGVDVTMAVDVGMKGKDDDTEHLVYATENDCILVTFDRPFAGRVSKRSDHAGLICLSEAIRSQYGKTIDVLLEFVKEHSLENTKGLVFWLKSSD